MACGSASLSSTQSSLITLALLLLSTVLLSPSPPDLHHSSPRRSLAGATNSSSSLSCSDVLGVPKQQRCSFSLLHCRRDVLNYSALHFCLAGGDRLLSLPLLVLLLALHFLFLARAASLHFSPVVSRLSRRLRLSPSMAAVTLLALGNGAPDAFASLAALRSGLPRTGLAATLSAGAFVSALVVGLVAIHASPFSVPPAPFLRDAFSYLLASSALFCVYLTGRIHLWQALALVSSYILFVVFVFRMDYYGEHHLDATIHDDILPLQDDHDDDSGNWFSWRNLGKMWELPVSTILKLTIPSISPAKWSRFYYSANIGLCPLVVMYALRSYIPLDHKIIFLIPQTHLPIWSIALFMSLSFSITYYILEKDPPVTQAILPLLVAFVMSVFWISTMAGELLNCLAAIGTIMNLPPALLGLTVLAWGNSVGDLVADVAVAKSGQPAMAMAGCFVGPMFNMLIGLGSALVRETANVYPEAYELQLHISIIVAFVFLLVSLMGSLLVIIWCRFRVPRVWGFCLVGLYFLFTVTSLVIARFYT